MENQDEADASMNVCKLRAGGGLQSLCWAIWEIEKGKPNFSRVAYSEKAKEEEDEVIWVW